jgi:hypothetical protein
VNGRTLFCPNVPLCLETLLEAGALAGALAQEEKAGAADLAVPFHHYFFDARGAEQERALDANTIAGYAANGKGRIGAIIASEQHGSLEFLDALAIAFFNLDMHADHITGPQGRDIRVFGGLKGFQQFAHLNILTMFSFTWVLVTQPDGSLGIHSFFNHSGKKTSRQARINAIKIAFFMGAGADYTIEFSFVTPWFVRDRANDITLSFLLYFAVPGRDTSRPLPKPHGRQLFMVSSFRSAFKGFSFPFWTVPIALFFLIILSYGLRALSLGFFWDDLPNLWFYHRFGITGITDAFSYDRPFLSFIYSISLTVLGLSQQSWQIFGLIAHWLYALGFWWMLSQVWPEQRHRTALAAFLFAVYPGFTQHWITVIYGQAFVLFASFFFSMGLSIWLVRSRDACSKMWLAAGTGAALLLSAFTMFSTEYFFGLELLRPLFFWMVLREAWSPGVSAGSLRPAAWFARQHTRQLVSAVKWWAPYLALMLVFVLWRAFIRPFPGKSFTTLEQAGQTPLAAVQGLFLTILDDVIEAGVVAWGQPLQLTGFVETSPDAGLRLLAVILLTALFAGLFLARLCPSPDISSYVKPISARRIRDHWAMQAVLAGIFALLVAGWPFWITGLPMRMGFPQDRYTLPLSVGVCLALAGLVVGVARSHARAAVLTAVAVGLAAGFHFNTALNYRQDMNEARDFFWQLTWRAPSLLPQTLVLTDSLPFTYYEDDSLSAGLNWTYDPQSRSQDLAYLLYDMDVRRGVIYPLQPGVPVRHVDRATHFNGNTSQVIVVAYDPPGCLKVLDPVYDADLYYLPEELLRVLHLSVPSQQISDHPASAEPPQEIFRNEPPRRWCYFFEKAELARQQADWDTIVQLRNDSIAQGYRPADPAEYLPFIEGMLQVGRWGDAHELTYTAYRDAHALRPALCAIWERAYPQEAPSENRPETLLADLKQNLSCRLP